MAKKKPLPHREYGKLCQRNFEAYSQTLNLFKVNVKEVCKLKGISFNSLFTFLKANGIKADRRGFLDFRPTTSQTNWTILIPVTFATALNVPTSLLFSTNLIEDFKRYQDETLDWQYTYFTRPDYKSQEAS